MNDPFVHPAHIDNRLPIDDLEPLPGEHDELRDAAIKFISIINAFSERLERAITHSTSGTSSRASYRRFA